MLKELAFSEWLMPKNPMILLPIRPIIIDAYGFLEFFFWVGNIARNP
jgi:hypothetical protein